MADRFIIRYCYNNDKLSPAASDHVFSYLSAFGNCRFVEDKERPIIWRGDDEKVQSSVKIVLSDELRTSGSDDDGPGNSRGIHYISPDPIEQIFEKLSLKTVLGPYSKSRYRPDHSPADSLGNIIDGFFNELIENEIIHFESKGISLWPDGHSFAMALTHDVDIPFRSVRGSFRLLFKKTVPGGFRGLFDSLKSAAGIARNPYDRIAEWIESEKGRGLKSTFFVFPGNRKNKYDPKYSIDKLKSSLDYIAKSDFELGLHSGIECHSGENLGESVELLQKKSGLVVSGLRPHYLSASLPGYWRSAVDSGFEYSSCLGFDEDIGFYRGLDLPFMPYDIENDSAINIIEIPIAIMDCGLINNEINDISRQLETGMKLIDRAKSAGGIIVLDWHARTLYNADYPGWSTAFFELTDYGGNEGAYFTTLGETSRLLKNKMADES